VPTAADVFGRLAAVDHLRGRDRAGFLDGLTPLLAEVNALHPFREGNGRTQRAFLTQLARDAGFRLRWEGVDRDANVDAARAAADGDLAPLRALLDPVVQPARRAQHR
jgi:cell filamentation protein